MAKKTLIDFLDEKLSMGNSWICFDNLTIYVRSHPVCVDNTLVKALTIANITNKNRASNVVILPKNKIKRTGEFATFLKFIEKTAKIRKFDGVYIENVLNDFLPSVLQRAGYKEVNVYPDLGAPCFWKQV